MKYAICRATDYVTGMDWELIAVLPLTEESLDFLDGVFEAWNAAWDVVRKVGKGRGPGSMRFRDNPGVIFQINEDHNCWQDPKAKEGYHFFRDAFSAFQEEDPEQVVEDEMVPLVEALKPLFEYDADEEEYKEAWVVVELPSALPTEPNIGDGDPEFIEISGGTLRISMSSSGDYENDDLNSLNISPKDVAAWRKLL